jgi:hypothetical protein
MNLTLSDGCTLHYLETGRSPTAHPHFVQLPTLASIDVAELLVTIRTQVLRLLATRGVIDTTQDLPLLPSDEAQRDPVLAQLVTAAVSGTAPAGPERRQRAPIHLCHTAGATITGPLCATDTGFSLHAATSSVAREVGDHSLRAVCILALSGGRTGGGLCAAARKRPGKRGAAVAFSAGQRGT